MKPTIFSKFNLPTLLLIAVILSVPGCQFNKFPVPSFPQVSIWNKDKMNLSPKELATPSSQFSPEFDNADDDLAQSANDNVQQKVEEISTGSEAKHQQSLNNQPIRQPYSLNSINPNLAPAVNNGFEPIKAPQGISQSSNTLGEPDNGFQNLKNTLEQLPQDLSLPANPTSNQSENSIPGWNNEFAPGTINQTKPDSPSGSTNSFQPVPPQARDLSSPIPPGSQGLGSFPANNSNGFGLPTPPGRSPNGFAPSSPNELLTPAPPTTNNLIQTAPEMPGQLPLAPIPQTTGQPISVPEGGTTIIGGIKLDRDDAPKADNSFGPIPFKQPDATPAKQPSTLPVTEPPSQPIGNPSSPDIPAVLRTENGGFAPGSIKELNSVDPKGQTSGSSN